MTSPPPPDPELRGLLAPLEDVPPFGDEARARVRARVQAVVDTAGGPSGSGPNGGAPPGWTPSTGGLVASGTLGGLAVGTVLGFLIASSVTGEGETAEPRPAPTAETVRAPDRPAEEPLEDPEGLPSELPPPARADEGTPQEEPHDVPRSDAPEPTPSRMASQSEDTPATAGQSLAAERRLIDIAFQALQQENPDAARRALSRHRRRFPTGALSPERDALEARLPATP